MRILNRIVPVAVLMGCVAATGSAQTNTSFTYQGKITSAGASLEGPADFQFRLYPALTGGAQVGPQVVANNTPVSHGLFTATLDFGSAFGAGQPRWLEIGVRAPAGSGNFTTLGPRQPISAAPLAQGLVGMPISPGGPETLDQNQTGGGSVGNFNVGFYVPCWQSFTAGASGALTRVELSANPTGSIGGDLTVQLYTGAGLTGTLLGTTTISQPVGHVPITFPGVVVKAGQVYTLGFSGQVLLESVVTAIPGAAGHYSLGNRSWWFRTYVTPVPAVSFANQAFFASVAETMPWTGLTGVPAVLPPWTAAAGGIGYAGGNLGIGNTSPAVRLHVTTGSVGAGWQVQLTNTAAPSVYQVGMRASDVGFFEMTNRITGYVGFARLDSTGVWTVVSDGRVKSDVVDAQGSLDAALRLHPVEYRYRAEGRGGDKHLGLIAQEVRDVLPEFVVGDEQQGLLTVNYAGLSVVAIGAVQELKQRQEAELDSLRAEKDAEIAALHSEVRQLRTELAAMKSLSARLAALEAKAAVSGQASSADSAARVRAAKE